MPRRMRREFGRLTEQRRREDLAKAFKPVERGVSAGIVGVAAQGRPGEDRAGGAVAPGNDDAAQMDLCPAADGVLEIGHSKAL